MAAGVRKGAKRVKFPQQWPCRSGQCGLTASCRPLVLMPDYFESSIEAFYALPSGCYCPCNQYSGVKKKVSGVYNRFSRKGEKVEWDRNDGNLEQSV